MPDNVQIELNASDLAILKDVFEDSKVKTLFTKEMDKYKNYCDLYRNIYLQVKGQNKKLDA